MDDKVIILGHELTARTKHSIRWFVLFQQSDQTEGGNYVPPQEIIMTREQMKRLGSFISEMLQEDD